MNYSFLIPSILAALTAYMLDFGFGHPSAENYNPHSLLFRYPLFLAKKQLKKMGLYADIITQLETALHNAPTIEQERIVAQNFTKVVYERGRQFFTWQYAFGICPICFSFWINVFFSILNFLVCLTNNVSFTEQIFLACLANHLVIRIIIKYA